MRYNVSISDETFNGCFFQSCTNTAFYSQEFDLQTCTDHIGLLMSHDVKGLALAKEWKRRFLLVKSRHDQR